MRGGNDGAFTYKSRKVVWQVVDEDKFFNNSDNVIPEIILTTFPVYSVVIRDTDNGKYSKYYGYMASTSMNLTGRNSNNYLKVICFEEAEGVLNNIYEDIPINTNNGIIGMLITLTELGWETNTEEEIITLLKDKFGLEKMSYEQYANAIFDFDYKYANF